jgi:DNA-binding SARP family transcriptional activator/tetratricopeptide (TPR) repeat protein
VLRLLGPVRWETPAGQVDLGAVKQRTVLAALAAEAGRLVTWTELVDRVWDQASATGSRGALYTYANRIRRLLEAVDAAADDGSPARLARRSGGYLLHLDPDQVDVHRFHRLTVAAEDPGCADGERARLLSEALGLWQGRPLADLPGQWAARNRESWRRQRLEVVVAWAGARLRLGEPDSVIGPVQELTVDYPLAEPLTGVLIRALAVAGRDAEALHCYAAYRARLIEELGAEPGPELRGLHEAVLRGSVPRPRRARGTPVTEAGRPVPARQLPAGVRHFVGRVREQQTLSGLLDEAAAGNSAVVISVIGGTAGVGKTALALHWAHRVADRFPDGQLYVNLRGFDPGGRVTSPAEAVRGFLGALGVPAERVPPSLDEQAALYRSLLAGRRVLVVLDNARDAEQVLPLLPGTPTALAIVTSRRELTSLVAGQCAYPLRLDVLTGAEARELLARRLGADRVAAEPAAVDQIVTRCARLPLALTIVAARAAESGFSLARLAGDLAESDSRLDALSAGESTSQIRAVFSWSYATLTSSAARLFRVLGLHPGPDISAAATASLAGCVPSQTRALLAELVGARLLTEHAPGRYAFHDLLRAYAAELAHCVETDSDRHAALSRILDHYLHTAHAADRLLFLARDLIVLSPAQPGVVPEHLADQREALRWFTSERATLMAAVDRAAAAGFDTHAWQLAWTLWIFLYRQGHWNDWATSAHAAVAAARRLADPTAEAHAHRSLGRAYTLLGRFDEARSQGQRALELFAQAGDWTGQAHIQHSLAYLGERRGDHAGALEHAQQALVLYRAAGHQVGQARALNTIGWCHALLGHYRRALVTCQRALPLHQELGDREGQAGTWDSLGYAHHHLGDHAAALTCYQHAIGLYRDIGDRYYEATTLAHLGDTHDAAGNRDAARQSWQQALGILDDLGHGDGDAVRAKLRQLRQARRSDATASVPSTVAAPSRR